MHSKTVLRISENLDENFIELDVHCVDGKTIVLQGNPDVLFNEVRKKLAPMLGVDNIALIHLERHDAQIMVSDKATLAGYRDACGSKINLFINDISDKHFVSRSGLFLSYNQKVSEEKSELGISDSSLTLS